MFDSTDFNRGECTVSRGKRSRPRKRSRWPAVLLAAAIVIVAAAWGLPRLLEKDAEPVSSQQPLPLEPEAEPAQPEEPSLPEPEPVLPPVPTPEPAPDPAEELLAGMTLETPLNRRWKTGRWAGCCTTDRIWSVRSRSAPCWAIPRAIPRSR